MRLRVQRRDGSMETIELLGDQMVAEPNPSLARLTGARMEHWFTPDGYYDGWGMFAPPGLTTEGVTEIIEVVEGSREIEPPTPEAPR